MRVFSQAAYILLNRPYSETSWVVEVFSRDFGRVALMAKGARRLKSKLKGALQPFQPVILSWTGKGEIPTLTSAEVNQNEVDLFKHQLRGDALVCGFYCNELLVNLLHRHDPHPSLFDTYSETILKLITAGIPSDIDANYVRSNHVIGTVKEPELRKVVLAETLRSFEQAVMKETGYEVSFLTEADGKTMILDESHYRFQPGEGFIRVGGPQANSVKGYIVKSLHGVGNAEASEEVVSQGKLLMREILQQTLGRKKIVSRDLFFPR